MSALAPVVFLDTGFAIALLSPRDAFHPRALALAAAMRTAKTRVVTSDAVLLEIGAALAKAAYRSAAAKLIAALRSDPQVDIVALDTALFDAAFALFQSRHDKDWSLTDCISFVIMRQRGFDQALAADEHFAQAGFTPLLARP